MEEEVDPTVMNNAPEQNLPPDEVTGLPGLRSWRTVYLVVLGTFVLWIGLLTILTRLYS